MAKMRKAQVRRAHALAKRMNKGGRLTKNGVNPYAVATAHVKKRAAKRTRAAKRRR